MVMNKVIGGVGIAVIGMMAMTGSAFAHDCTNASKDANNPAAGVQAIVDTNTGTFEWLSAGLQQRVSSGLVDLNTGAGFHGLIGLDFNSDGVVDAVTYLVGPASELPQTAQNNGSPCHGVTSLDIYFSQCVS